MQPPPTLLPEKQIIGPRLDSTAGAAGAVDVGMDVG